jgi:hypothetical protein
MSVVTSVTNSRFANTISNSLSNIRAHYDLSNGMFEAFLSRDMTYSCGIFPELDGDLRQKTKSGHGTKETDVDELEQSQLAKLRYAKGTFTGVSNTDHDAQTYHKEGKNTAGPSGAGDWLWVGEHGHRGLSLG